MASYIPDAHGRGYVTVKNDDGSSIVVYEQGAHITSWKTADGEEHLYVSPKAVYAERVPIRGGVPIIFPQFGNRGPLTPSHGFARIRLWKLEDIDNGRASFSLRVQIDDLSVETPAMSDSEKNVVILLYTVEFSNTMLKMNVKVTNTSEEVPASFHLAYHTYWAVEELNDTIINGFNLSPYIDQLKGTQALQKPQRVWTLTGETDRIYPNQGCGIMLQDVKRKRILHISSPNLPDMVLWNPGKEGCGKFKDLPADAYSNFVCVEHGSIMKKVVLKPNSSWNGTHIARVLPMDNTPAKL